MKWRTDLRRQQSRGKGGEVSTHARSRIPVAVAPGLQAAMLFSHVVQSDEPCPPPLSQLFLQVRT